MRTEYQQLRDAAEGEHCIRCGKREGVVLCHYTGARRLAYLGGLGAKVHDLVGAHMCPECHKWMDTLSRDKASKWEHSEEFQHAIILTILRLLVKGTIAVKGART